MRKSLIFLVSLSCGKVVGDLPADSGAPIDSGGSIDSASVPDAPMGTIDARIIDAAMPDGAVVVPTTIKTIRMQPPGDGVAVALRNVMLVAKDSRGPSGVLILQDTAGGDFSGITLFCNFGAGSDCNLSRTQVEAMPIGKLLDVDAEFDVVFPPGSPAPPPMPRLVRANVRMLAGTVNPTARVVAPGLVRPDQGMQPATAALLWTYVKVEGAIVIQDTMPPSLEAPCPNPQDAGVPGTGHRGVISRVNGTSDMIISMRADPMAMYCLFECEITCQNAVAQNDSFQFIAGVLDTFNRDAMPQQILVVPVRNTDVGPMN